MNETPRRDTPWALRIPKAWKPEAEQYAKGRDISQHAYLIALIRTVPDAEAVEPGTCRHRGASMTLQVILTRGLPGSGKSTWAMQKLADEPGRWKRVNKDDLQAMLDGGRWSKANEKFVLAMRDHVTKHALGSGFNVIVNDTNFAKKHLLHIKELVRGQAVVEIQRFDTPLEECIKRDLQRPNSVGEAVIRGMYDRS